MTIARHSLLLLLGFVCLTQTVYADEAASDAAAGAADADADLAAAAEAVTAASEAA